MQRQGTFPLAYKFPGKWESLDTADSEAVDKSDFFSPPPQTDRICIFVAWILHLSAPFLQANAVCMMEVKQIVCYFLGNTKKQKTIVLNIYPRWGEEKKNQSYW